MYQAPLEFTFGGRFCTVSFPPQIDLAGLSTGDNTLVVVERAVRRALCYSGHVHLEIQGGESAKQDWSSVGAILQAGLEAGLDRRGRLIVAGGGAVCDVGAFAASILLRGVAVTLVPTTLLAMVDAAVGGKTAIDYLSFKNMVGTFHPAAQVVIDVGVLQTLPFRDYRSGFGEVVKTALLEDCGLLERLEEQCAALQRRQRSELTAVVAQCVRIKGSVVEADPTEQTGRRALLNLGHTFAHALESATGLTRWTHGEAVAWGTLQALKLARHLGLAEGDYVARVGRLLSAFGFPLVEPSRGVDPQRILTAMRADKKRVGTDLRFVVPRTVGTLEVRSVDPADVLAVLLS